MVEDVKVENAEDQVTCVNFNSGPVTVVLPNNRRVTLKGEGEGRITGPRKIMKQYFPVLTPVAVGGAVRSKSQQVLPRTEELTEEQKAAFQALEGKQDDNRDREGLTPFSTEIEIPPILRGVNYEDPLTLDMIHADEFAWNKVKTKRLSEFAEENLIDVHPAEGNRMKMMKIIREMLGEV